MKSKDPSRRTTILLSGEEYFFLLQKVFDFRKMNRKATIGSLVRDLIEKEMKTRKKDLWK
jgi:hypothetical protein